MRKVLIVVNKKVECMLWGKFEVFAQADDQELHCVVCLEQRFLINFSDFYFEALLLGLKRLLPCLIERFEHLEQGFILKCE